MNNHFASPSNIRLPEGPVRTINKKAVYVALAIGFVLVGLVLTMLVSGTEKKQKVVQSEDSTLPEKLESEALNRLPDSYEELSAKQMAIDEERGLDDSSERFEESEIRQYRAEYAYSPPSISGSSGEAHDESESARRSSMMFASNSQPETNNEPSPSPSGQDDDLFFSKKQRALSEKEMFIQGSRGARGIQGAPAFAVMQGSVLPAVLLTAINSDLPGPILAQISTNIFDSKSGRFLLIPQGSKLVGEYNSGVSFGQERAQVVWTRLILPDSSSVDLGRMPGVDDAGASGVKGTVDNHYGKLIMGVLVTTLIGGTLNNAPISPGGATPQQALGQALGQEVARVGTKIAEKNFDVPPTLKIAAGTKMNVFATADLLLKPYRT